MSGQNFSPCSNDFVFDMEQDESTDNANEGEQYFLADDQRNQLLSQGECTWDLRHQLSPKILVKKCYSYNLSQLFPVTFSRLLFFVLPLIFQILRDELKIAM